MSDDMHERARRALLTGLRRARPSVVVDAGGRTARLEDNLVEGIARESFEADFRASSGPEFEIEMREPHASSTLAANVFAPWRRDPAGLSLAGETGFSRLGFDKSCATGLDGPPAFLDLFAESPQAAIGVEIKLLEYLRQPAPGYAEGFQHANQQALREITDARAKSRWFDQIRLLHNDPDADRVLYAPQLLKQYIALTYCYPERRKRLLYLYWEPTNWRDFEVFRTHREELDRFAAALAGDEVGFQAQSFAELWAGWTTATEPAWLGAHARRLQARYDVAL